MNMINMASMILWIQYDDQASHNADDHEQSDENNIKRNHDNYADTF